MTITLVFLKQFTCIVTYEAMRCSENNGGCQDRCEESNTTGQVVCSCSNSGTRLSADMKSCAGKAHKHYKKQRKKELEYYRRIKRRQKWSNWEKQREKSLKFAILIYCLDSVILPWLLTCHSFKNNIADVDECTSDPCQEEDICINSWGSYVCLSQPTQDINECLNSPCPDEATCINTPGSFRCLEPSIFW